MNPTPEFLAAIDRHQAMATTLGLDHTLTRRAMHLVQELAPPELKAVMAAKAREMGLVPKQPDGYTNDGTPCYSIEAIAKQLDMTVQEVKEGVAEMMAHRAELGLPPLEMLDPATIHKVQ